MFEIKPYGVNAVFIKTESASESRNVFSCLKTSNAVKSVIPTASGVGVNKIDNFSFSDFFDIVKQSLDSFSFVSDTVVDRIKNIEVFYDGEDLSEVSKITGLSVKEIVTLHSKVIYVVDFLGFSPGFPYLSGLSSELNVPRLETPRSRVPAGAVGLAAGKTCVYPSSSPGGWLLIGHTEQQLFDIENIENPAYLLPGDKVKFIPKH